MLLNYHISAAIRAISTKFGKVTQFDPLDRFERKKFLILKIQDGDGRHFKNRKITISRLQFKRF